MRSTNGKRVEIHLDNKEAMPFLGSDSSSLRHWPRSEKQLWVVTLFLGCTMVYMCRTIMPLCTLSVSKYTGWDKAEMGSVLSSFFWGYTMTQVIGGNVSDRIGGDIVIMLAAVGWALASFWTPYLISFSEDHTTALYIVVAARVFMGACQGLHFPAITSLLAQRVPESERALSYSSVLSGSIFGTLVTGSMGSVILEYFGWQTTFYVTGLISMSWVFFLRYYLIARDRRRMRLLQVKDENVKELEQPPVPWGILFRSPAFWSTVAGHFCHTWAFHIFISWLPTYFQENFPLAKGWIFNVVPWLINMPCMILSGWLADKLIAKGFSVTFVRKLFATVTLFGVAFFLVLLSFTSTFEGCLFCMACAVACSGFHVSGVLINPQDIAPKFAGSVFGIMNMAGAIPGFVGVYIAGHVLKVTHSWSMVFNQTAFVSLIGYVIFMYFGTGKQIV